MADEGAPFSSTGAGPSSVQYAELGAAGRLVIPAAMRSALGIMPGDKLILRLEGDELRVYTFRAGVSRIQKMLQEADTGNRLGVDEFLAWRRREAARELLEFEDD
jgi:AbrB family looped-hinge helix DNA binding protein